MSIERPISFKFEETREVETSRTYGIDWDNGRIIGMVDGIEAVKQYIKKVLTTSRFKCLIYNSQYGSEINEVIANSATRDYMEAELPFLVSDALIHDERILKVYNISFVFEVTEATYDSVVISFDVDTIFGTMSMNEVYEGR